VLLVVWTHAQYLVPPEQRKYFGESFGDVGVDIFFVISGFVVSSSARTLNFDPRKFFFDRFSRVAPTYWATSIPFILLSAYFYVPNWKSVAATFLFFPFFDFQDYSWPSISAGWTLSFEFWFYSTYALALLLFGRRGWIALLAFYTAGIAVIFNFYDSSYLLPRFLFHPLMLEFSLGILIFHFREKINFKMAIFGAVASVLFLLHLSTQGSVGNFMPDPIDGFRRLASWGACGFFIVLTTIGIDHARPRKWPRWMMNIGGYSFSIYLVQSYAHLFVMRTVKYLSAPPVVNVILFIVLTFLFGWLASNYVEKPLTHYLRNRFRKNSPVKAPFRHAL